MRRAAAVGVAGPALILVALLFDAAPLFVPGVALVVLAVTAPLWVMLAARSAQIERRLDSDRVVEDEPIEATIEVRRGNWGLPGAAVVDPLAGAPVPIHAAMSLISGGRSASVRIVACFPRRGIRRIDPPSLIVSDALELARIVRVSPSRPQEILVLPRTERIRWVPGAGEKWRRAAGFASLEPLGATEVDGLRPYRQGTPASRIHWPALARGAGLLERRLRADTDSRPLVVLDARQPGSPAEPEHLDAAVRAAASLVFELGSRTGCGLLMPGEHRPLEVEPDLTAWPWSKAARTRGLPVSRPGRAPRRSCTSPPRRWPACRPASSAPACAPRCWLSPSRWSARRRRTPRSRCPAASGSWSGSDAGHASASGSESHERSGYCGPDACRRHQKLRLDGGKGCPLTLK